MSEDRPGNGRLDSWKEIADYLKRDSRTAMRWQEKGLPVHRVPGGKRQAVFAYDEEIDDWLAGNHPNANKLSVDAGGGNPPAAAWPEEQPEIAAAGPKREATGRSYRIRKWILAATLCLAAAGSIMWSITRQPLVAASIRVVSLKQLTDDGHTKLAVRTDGTSLYFTEIAGARVLLMSAPMTGSPVRHIETPFANVSLQDLSKDGKNLLVFSYEGIFLEGPLWVVPVQGGTLRRIGEAQCSAARWSPDNSRIACAYRTSISVMNSDGSKPRTLASLSSPVSLVGWTPDGRHLRYTLQDMTDHTFSQWEVPLDHNGTAGKPQKLGFGADCCAEWSWTADGKASFAADFDKIENSRLMIKTARSRQTTEVPLNIGTLWSVASGPSGNLLYLLIGSASRSELLKFDAKENSLQTYLPGISGEYLAFSPDRKWITYTDAQNSLWRSRVDGSEALQLTKPSMEVQVSSWSPDGWRVAFMGRIAGKPWRIYLIDRDSGEMREASEGEDNQGGPSWSPDGKKLVYGNVFCEKTQECWIRRMNLATRETEIIPGSNGLRTARWSPDGKYIAALKFQTHELMLFDLRRQRWQALAGSVNGDNVSWSSDSRYIYVDSPRDKKPVVERVRIRDGWREPVVSLGSLQKISGALSPWIGLTPDNAPILSHVFTASDVYRLEWTDR
jgi:Tol biopolymer transport system component